MAGDLFHDLPPPSAPQSQQIAHSTISQESSPKPPPPPAPVLKSALKRPKPQVQSQPEGSCCKSFGIFYYLLYLLSLLIWFFVFTLL